MPENITLTNDQLQAIIERTIAKYKKEVKPKKTNRKYVSIKEFAEYFGMHKQGISKLIRERKIYAEQMYGTTAWRIPVEGIENYKQNSRKQTQKDFFTRNF
jgi:excisionase family DNA binding protein